MNEHQEREQLEILQELGRQLKEERIQQNISLSTIAKDTRIQLHLLEAIEAGNKEALPEAVYIRSFIKQFANYLGWDGEEFARAFPMPSIERKPAPQFRFYLPRLSLRPAHLYLLYVLLLFVSMRALVKIVDLNPAANLPAPTQPATAIKQEESQEQTLPTAPVSVQPVATSSPDRPVVVEIKVQSQSWLRVVADGKTEFEGILTRGSDRTWTAREQLTIRAGNAGGLFVTFNNQEAKKLGSLGQVQEVTYKADRL